MSVFAELLGEIRSALDRAIDALVAPGAPCALLDYPNHENVGDAAIWAGERALLRAHGRQTVYVGDITGYSRGALRRRLGPDGVILLHGGGNFGDLYPHHQMFRERVIRDFPDHRIVMLPQTATFRSEQHLERARTAFDGHGNVTLVLRDDESYRFVNRHFQSPSMLIPDSAFALGPWSTTKGTLPIVWLARTDHEGVGDRDTITARSGRGGPAISVVDWAGKRSAPPPLVAWRQTTLIAGAAAGKGLRCTAMSQWLETSFDRLAARRVQYGAQMLGQAKVVVTDRLHAHIFSLMLGKPHVLINDRYDKVGRFFRTWVGDHPAVRMAEDPNEALERARDLAATAR